MNQQMPTGDAIPPRRQDAVLLTTSCTTGWADWVHGELWLCSDGLLRVSLGLAATIAKESSPSGSAAYEASARETGHQQFDVAEINELISRKRTNRWIPWIQISEFSLRNGITTGRLRLTLADGRSVNFLWKRDSKVSGLLRDVLDELVGRQ